MCIVNNVVRDDKKICTGCNEMQKMHLNVEFNYGAQQSEWIREAASVRTIIEIENINV